MGTLNWTVTSVGSAIKGVKASSDNGSGAFTTSISAAAVTSLSPHIGQIVQLTASEDMWVRFGGRTSAVGTGHFLPAGVPEVFEVVAGDGGAVSAIDVA